MPLMADTPRDPGADQVPGEVAAAAARGPL
jgi:hypothetical protein